MLSTLRVIPINAKPSLRFWACWTTIVLQPASKEYSAHRPLRVDTTSNKGLHTTNCCYFRCACAGRVLRGRFCCFYFRCCSGYLTLWCSGFWLTFRYTADDWLGFRCSSCWRGYWQSAGRWVFWVRSGCFRLRWFSTFLVASFLCAFHLYCIIYYRCSYTLKLFFSCRL